jgi:hypothetical protein
LFLVAKKSELGQVTGRSRGKWVVQVSFILVLQVLDKWIFEFDQVALFELGAR